MVSLSIGTSKFGAELNANWPEEVLIENNAESDPPVMLNKGVSPSGSVADAVITTVLFSAILGLALEVNAGASLTLETDTFIDCTVVPPTPSLAVISIL